MSFPAEGIVFSDELMELDQGDWQGRKKSEVYTPEMLKIINSSQPYFKAPNGESQYTVGKRMLACLEQIIDSNENGNSTIAVFTHGIAIKCLLRELLNFPPENVYKTILENTSITELVCVQGNWQVIRINDAEHLQKNRL